MQEAIDKGVMRVGRHPTAPLNLPYVLHTALDVASAMACLHHEGVLHGGECGCSSGSSFTGVNAAVAVAVAAWG